MDSFRRLLLMLLVLAASTPYTTYGQQTLQLSEDLAQRWTVFDKGAYRSFLPADAGARVIYIALEASHANDQRLRIHSRQHPVLFVNGKLFGRCEADTTTWPVDSLRLFARSSRLLVGVYQKNINPANLQTQLVTRSGHSAERPSLELRKPVTYFRDFVIIGSLFLLILFTAILRMNFKLTSDYFSVIKIFTGQESEDIQVYTRIGSGSNIVFYVFCCLLLSFYLIVIFHFVPGRFTMAWLFHTTTFQGALRGWIWLAVILFAVFMLKVALIYSMARLFGLSEIFGLHVFNWIRLMLTNGGLLTAILVVYHVSRGLNENVYSALFWCLAWVLIGWTVILFPKVVRRSGFSLFHIFSYLCLTEIIPLLISIKLLYN